MNSLDLSSGLLRGVLSFAIPDMASQRGICKVVLLASTFFVSKKPIVYGSLAKSTCTYYLLRLTSYCLKKKLMKSKANLVSKIRAQYQSEKKKIEKRLEFLLTNAPIVAIHNPQVDFTDPITELKGIKEKIEAFPNGMKDLQEEIEAFPNGMKDLQEEIEAFPNGMKDLQEEIEALSEKLTDLKGIIAIEKKIIKTHKYDVSIVICLFFFKKFGEIRLYKHLKEINCFVDYVCKNIFLFLLSTFFSDFMKKTYDRNTLLKLFICFSLFFFVLEKICLKKNRFIIWISKQSDLYGLKIIEEQIFDYLMKSKGFS